MKTPEPPRSSKRKGKGGESAPEGETPMARFRATAKVALAVPYEKILREEDRTKKARGAAKKRKTD